MAQTVEQIRAEYDTSQGRDFHAEGRFAVVNCTIKDGKNGKFAVVELRDGTGSLTARLFEASLIDALQQAGAVDARLKVGEFNGSMSTVIQAFDAAQLSRDDILELAGLDLEVHRQRVAQLEAWMQQCDGTIYGDVIRALFFNPDDWDSFTMAPAAVRLHHAEPGGLVRHLCEVGLAGLALLDSTGAPYDRAYFLAGVFMHDIGKLDTYTLPPTISYTAQGQLGEHQIFSTFRLAKACARVEVPAAIEAKLVHIIEQAHGAYRHAEWQDPLGVEAKALACADFFSSRLGVTDKERRSQDALDKLFEDDAAAISSRGDSEAGQSTPRAAGDQPSAGAGLF